MVAQVSITTPAVSVNGQNIAIVANSFSYMDGDPERLLSPQSAGGGAVEMVESTDISTAFGEFNFSLRNTNENLNLIREWKDNRSNNVVSISAPGFSRVFEEAILMNKVSVGLSSDGQSDLSWQSRPSI